MLNIAIADDQVLFRKGMVNLINQFSEIRVCIEAVDGQDLLEQLKQTDVKMDVTLIDLSMPRLNGIETLRAIKGLYPGIKNIILSTHEEEKYIYKLIEEGANAYLAKNAEVEEIEKAIRFVVANDFYFNERTITAMRNFIQFRNKNQLDRHGSQLTNREREILLLICREFTSYEIAQKLFITESTVNGHRNNLLLKIGCRNTAGLVAFAFKNQLWDPEI